MIFSAYIAYHEENSGYRRTWLTFNELTEKDKFSTRDSPRDVCNTLDSDMDITVQWPCYVWYTEDESKTDASIDAADLFVNFATELILARV